MAEEVVGSLEIQERVGEAAVADVDFGGLDEAFFHISRPGAQSADEEEVFQQLDVAGGALDGDGKAGSELGDVELFALVVREHGPESAEGDGRDAGAELGNVAFKIGADEVHAPAHAGGVGGGEETVGKSAAEPEGVLGVIDFENREAGELFVGDATGEGFGGLLEQVERGGPEDKELAGGASGAAMTVDDAAQDLEEVGSALNFVEDDEPVGVGVEVVGGMGQLGEIDGIFEIEINRSWGEVGSQSVREGGFADLTGSENSNSREFLEKICELGLF